MGIQILWYSVFALRRRRNPELAQGFTAVCLSSQQTALSMRYLWMVSTAPHGDYQTKDN